MKLLKSKMFLPYMNYQTVYDIDFNKLYSDGKRYILTDLDNTIISYAYSSPTQKEIELFQRLKEIGFKIVIVSNSPGTRVKGFTSTLDVYGVSSSRKPLLAGMKRALRHLGNPPKEEVIFIGDQLMTDVLVGNRLGLDTLFVMPLEEKSEKWYTKFNRRLERIVVRRIKKKHPELYKKLLGDRYGN